MSDSVTNVEIEDVLSSIRRLFSEEKKPLGSASDLVSDTQQKRKEALVLTPAFRVMESPKPVQETAGSKAPLFLHKSAEVVPAPATDADVTAERDVVFEHRAEPLILEKPLNRETEAPTSSETIRADISRAQSRLEATIAELEAAISGQPNDWEPDGSEADDSLPETQPLEWDAPESEVGFERALAPEEQSIDIAFMQQPTQRESKVTPFGNDRAVNDDKSEGEPPKAAAKETPHLREVVTATRKEELPVEEDYFDEEMFREMVSEVVREELQGALGERITRNVRKLVRREIQRIVSTQDF